MADEKLSDLTAVTTPASTDIAYVVVDPAGTPLDRKVTVANLRGPAVVPTGGSTGQVLAKTSGTDYATAWTTPSSGSALTVKDEGSTLSSAVTSIDFVGAGVVATNTGGAVTVTISGGGGGSIAHKVTKWAGAGSNLTTSSTSFVDIDATNIPALSLTLAVGDVVDLELVCTVAFAAGNVIGFDWLVDQPTSSDTNLRGSGWAAYLYEPGNSGTDANTQHIAGTFVATEIGVHTFKPQWRVSSSTGTINLTGTYWGPITHRIRNFGNP